VAGLVIWQGQHNAGLSAVSWLRSLTTGQIAGLVGGVAVLGLLATEGWFLVQLFQQHGRLLVRLDALERQLAAGGMAIAPAPTQRAAGLPIGSPAPAFSLSDLEGKSLALDTLRAANKPVMLIFVDPDCGPCTSLLPEVARWQHDLATPLTIALISRGTRAVNHAWSAEHGLTLVLLQQDHEVAQAYQVTGTPTAVIVRADGPIGSLLAEGTEAIGNLVARTVGLPAATTGCNRGKGNGNGNGHGADVALTAPVARIGESAPAFKLPDVSGKTIDLADFRGSSTLVLFWNPGCGFCARMLDELKAWEINTPIGAPKLLVVSTGSVEANQAMHLRSTVVLDQSFSVGRAFGVNGTPSAVLVDAQGMIVSQVAVGASAVLALAGAERGAAQPVVV
jgi:peroxiredoxin